MGTDHLYTLQTAARLKEWKERKMHRLVKNLHIKNFGISSPRVENHPRLFCVHARYFEER